MQIIAQTIVK